MRKAGFAAVLLIATTIRLVSLPLRGTEDVGTWKLWMIAASKDVTTVLGWSIPRGVLLVDLTV
jgi:hypothetical protein